MMFPLPQGSIRLQGALLAVVFLVMAGCGTTGRVQQQLAQQMMLGNYPAALQLIEQQKTTSLRGKNRLLYYLERGMLLHVNGQYAESNTTFEEAKRIGTDNYTKSLSSAGLTLMTND